MVYMTMTVDSDLNGASPQFILTCVSTGGPATTVTWTRDSGSVVGDEVTVFDTTTAATTAQYTHTLTVTGRLMGLYQCNVSNDKPSQDSFGLYVGGIYLETLYNIMYTCTGECYGSIMYSVMTVWMQTVPSLSS